MVKLKYIERVKPGPRLHHQHSESDWFRELEDSLEDEDEALEETFFEKSAKAVSNTLISLEKLRLNEINKYFRLIYNVQFA